MTAISDKYNYKNFSDKSPLIVFVHGAGCDSTFWSLLIVTISLRDTLL